MGGKSPPPPQQYSPGEQAAAQISIDDAAAKRDELNKWNQAKADMETATAKTTAGNNKINSLLTGGQTWGQNKANSLGYADSYGLLNSFNESLNKAATGADPLDTNFNDDFNYEDMWSKAVSGAQSGKQTELDNKFRGMTKPGWQNQYFADTADDSILDSILGQQYDDAYSTIDAARARGQLSEGAFGNTVNSLNTKKQGARSTLEDLGLGVLGGYRNQLGDIGKTWGDQVTNYKLGQDLNLDDFTGAVNQRVGDLSGRLSGDIYKAVGDTSLFNTDTLMAKGGAAAGASNNPLKTAFLTPEQQAAEDKRTTGTTGTF